MKRNGWTALTLLVGCFFHLSPALAEQSPILGNIDGITFLANGQPAILGWTCQLGNSNSLQTNVYLGGVYHQGRYSPQLSLLANQPSEPEINQSCEASGNFRFVIPIPSQVIQQAHGKPIYLYGLDPKTSGVGLATQSGQFTIPSLNEVRVGATCNGAQCNFTNAPEEVQTSLACANGLIDVQSAVYGFKQEIESCQAYVASACNGQRSCKIELSNTNCGGDPAPGIRKQGSAVVSCMSGNFYFADSGNNVIRQMLSNGSILTVVGNGSAGYSGDGASATRASLNHPSSVVADGAGNLYISDSGNNVVRKVNSLGIITTLAGNGKASFSGDGGQASLASLNSPSGLALDSNSNLYIADTRNNVVRQVTQAGIISTVAGNGLAGYVGDGSAAVSASLEFPMGVAITSSGTLLIADTFNNVIRQVSAGTISTFAGSGVIGYSGDGGAARSATLQFPENIAVGPGGAVLISDTFNNVIRAVDSDGNISTLVGTGSAGYSGDVGLATQAQLQSPLTTLLDSSGNLIILDGLNNAVRAVYNINGSSLISTLIGKGAQGPGGDLALNLACNGVGVFCGPAPQASSGPLQFPSGFAIVSSNKKDADKDPLAYGGTSPLAQWEFTQWGSAVADVPGFISSAVGSTSAWFNRSASAAFGVVSYMGNFTEIVEQNGSHQSCNDSSSAGNAGQEFDSFIQPVGPNANYPQALSASSYPLSGLSSLMANGTYMLLQNSQAPGPTCQYNHGNLGYGAILVNNVAKPEQIFWYNVRFTSSCVKASPDNGGADYDICESQMNQTQPTWYWTGAAQPYPNGGKLELNFAVSDVLSSFGYSQIQDYQPHQLNLNLLSRFTALLQSPQAIQYGMDTDLSHWTIKESDVGESSWGKVVHAGQFQGFYPVWTAK
jgi:hypothetical protein